jgi:predicted metal-dependent phosphoesterase TrpH
VPTLRSGRKNPVSYTELFVGAHISRMGQRMLRYDLHSHSTASDGTVSPAELIRHAAAQGVDVLALTDHDATTGLAEAEQAAGETGVTLVPGVEISVTWVHQLLHIVGLGIDPRNDALQRGLAGLRDFRVWRAKEMGLRLEKRGIAEAYAGAQALAKGPSIGRTHFARFLVAQGKAKDMQGAFDKYLKRGKPGYVPGKWASLGEAVGWIRAAGGQAVIAHPSRYALSASRFRALLAEFKEAGGVAMEVISGSHPHGATAGLANYAQRYELLASVGSDYHGPGQSYNELGRLPGLPAGCVPVWTEWDLPQRQASSATR